MSRTRRRDIALLRSTAAGWSGTVERLLPLVATEPDAATLRERAREDGFVYLPQALPGPRLAALRAVVDAALAKRGWVVEGRTDPALRLGRWSDERWLGFLAEVLGSEAYRTFAKAPELLDLLRAILDGEPRLYVGNVCRLVSPGAIDLTTPPHQDAANLADARDVWTAWIPLGPCPFALGPLAVLAGSHREGLRSHAPIGDGAYATEVPDDAPWRSHHFDAGDVIVFSAFTVHRALPNVTADQLRVSVGLRYRAA